jgi:type II secretory pathway pseudopilin PulG
MSAAPGHLLRPVEARGRCADDTGSILVEALVAIAIVAMMLAAGYSVIGASALRARAAETARTAGLIAQSQMSAVGATIPLEPGDTDGVEGGFTWNVAIDEDPAEASTTGRLLRVTVTVRTERAERARLTSLRLAPGV